MSSAAATTEEVLARLRAFKQRREAEYALSSLGVFGSFARAGGRATLLACPAVHSLGTVGQANRGTQRQLRRDGNGESHVGWDEERSPTMAGQELHGAEWKKGGTRTSSHPTAFGELLGNDTIAIADNNVGREEKMDRDEVLRILREFKRDWGEKFGILELGLFGSVARGAAGKESDVDVCVKTRTPDPFLLVHIKEGIEERVRKHVDIVRVREKIEPVVEIAD